MKKEQKHRKTPSKSVSTIAVEEPKGSTRKSTALLIGGGIVLATAAVYWQILHHQFIDLDDPKYLYQNSMVAAGLTIQGTVWAFTTFFFGNWHPLTWLSLMLDVQLFGMNPGPHLLVNLLFHVLNSLLVFVLLKEATPHIWRSGMVAALFALHPMRVESVAWASERKDVLSSFFALLCLWAYIRYVKSESATWKRLVPVIVFLVLSLMTKSMFVTAPFVMLILDFWPLKRLQWRPGGGIGALAKSVTPLIREKIPLFAVVALSIVVTYAAQASGGAVADAPLSLRASNAVVSYVKYIALLIWPTGLGVFYPYPPVPLWQAIGALALLAIVTALAIRLRQTRGYFLVGWAWFLGTLIPVIGIVKIGSQSMADRYSYLPSIGLFLIVAWGIAEAAARYRVPAPALRTCAVLWLAILAALTFIQVGHWKDSVTLYKHSIATGTPSVLVHYNLGNALASQGKLDEAAANLNEVLRINPSFVDGLITLATVLTGQRKFEEATTHLTKAINVEPKSTRAHLQFGFTLTEAGNIDEAILHFRRALDLSPNDFTARSQLAVLLLRKGKPTEAKEHLVELVRLDPNNPEVHNSLGIALMMEGQPEKGAAEFSTALRLRPDFKGAEKNLEAARKLQMKADPR